MAAHALERSAAGADRENRMGLHAIAADELP
jgi:hypothetical protein